MATSKAIFFAADADDQAFEVLRQALQAHEQNACEDGELSHMQCTLGIILVCRPSTLQAPQKHAFFFVFRSLACDEGYGGQHPSREPLG